MESKREQTERFREIASRNVLSILDQVDRLEQLSDDIRAIGNESFRAPYSSEAVRITTEWNQ